MKKTALCLALLLLFSVLVWLTACTPSTDPAGSSGSGSMPADETPHETTDTSPENGSSEKETETVYSGPLPSDRGFRAEYIQNDGTSAYYTGKTTEELKDRFMCYSNADWEYINGDIVTPLYTILWNGYRDSNYLGVYNKITGKTSLLCTDPFCTHEFCVWYESPDFLYIGKEHIYFLAGDWDHQNFYRCWTDFGEPELLFSLNQQENIGSFAVYHEDGDVLYLSRTIPNEKGEYVQTYGTFDCTTWEFSPIPAADGWYIETITGGDTLWCRKDLNNGYVRYRANLDFSEIERCSELENILKNSSDRSLYIQKITENYVVIGRNGTASTSPTAVILYDHKTGDVINIPEAVAFSGLLSGIYTEGYVYYTRDLSDEEIASSPLKDYYEYETTYDYLRPGSGVSTGRVETVTGDKRGGRLYRMNLSTFEEECVLVMTFDDVPVKIHSFRIEGSVCYIAYETYEEFQNYYHEERDQHLPEHHLIVDFGTGEILIADEDVTYE